MSREPPRQHAALPASQTHREFYTRDPALSKIAASTICESHPCPVGCSGAPTDYRRGRLCLERPRSLVGTRSGPWSGPFLRGSLTRPRLVAAAWRSERRGRLRRFASCFAAAEVKRRSKERRRMGNGYCFRSVLVKRGSGNRKDGEREYCFAGAS